jgi:hypothetical protein
MVLVTGVLVGILWIKKIITFRKTTLETSREDVKTTLETSGKDVKTTLETSGEDHR